MPVKVLACAQLFGVIVLFSAAQLGAVEPWTDESGLPASETPMPVYGEDPNSELNRLHQLLFIQSLVPEEVHAALPSERQRDKTPDSKFYTRGWYFLKRDGDASDRRVFGGDVRVSPVSRLDEKQRTELLGLLDRVSAPDQCSELQSSLVKALVQWDIASLWWQWEKQDLNDPELLNAMARAIAALGQPADKLKALSSGVEQLRENFSAESPTAPSTPYFPSDFDDVDGDAGNWIEVGRISSALFKADRSLHASKVYLRAGSRERTLQLIEDSTTKRGAEVDVPNETEALLIQQIIAFDDQLRPVVTPVVDDVRVRALDGPAVLSARNNSSSRDGSSHWVYRRTRFGSIRDGVSDFEFVPDTFESLFVEYGTQKHATYSAQCALCHRRTNNGGQAPEGFRVLTRHSDPHPADVGEREQLSLQEMKPVVNRLRERLAGQKAADRQKRSQAPTNSGAGKMPPRAERSAQERIAWGRHLRENYGKDPSQWPAPKIDEGASWQELGLLPAMQHPSENPYSEPKAELGKLLFFDPRLSGSGQIACASCHDPDLAWADGRTTSFGHSRELLRRNAPTVQNSGYFKHLFWDGRAGTLEEQVIHVLENPSEMHASEQDVVREFENLDGYRDRFAAAFGTEDVTFKRIAQAIACYERTIVGGNSPFDRYLKGDEDALSDSAIVGLDLFRREARCIHCHNGPMFSDSQLHDVGLSYYGRKFEDLGRYAVTGNANDVGRFRTPSLRNITRTRPLMHNGLFELPGVLNMYNAGMPTLRRKESQLGDPLFPQKSHLLKPLGLNKQDLADLIAFLTALEEPKRRTWPPELPR
ncbi:MAG: cytochrome-c peroxidase [Rhodopirellula sp. JB055]|uniref:cytochrome-c peroxidase n=1 Tax=Rhodopirellula sp. JB055 TaxID=3342846 RepID=UPI00370BAC84